MTDTLFRDISEHNQIDVGDIIAKTDEQVVLFRSADGTYQDHKFVTNLALGKHACDTGRLACIGDYFVFEDNWQATLSTFKQQIGKPHPKMFLVIDLETWGGKITGDHSRQVNAVRGELIRWLRSNRGPITRAVDAILGRQHKRVLVYGNVGDLTTLFPRRPRGLRYIVAAYGSNPDFPGKIAHQFSDSYTADGLPAGDINSADGLSPLQFAAKVGCVRLTARQRVALFKAHRRNKKGRK